MYNSRLQKKITQFLLEADDDDNRMGRKNIKSGAFSDIDVSYNGDSGQKQKLNFQNALGVARRRAAGNHAGAEKYAQNAFIRRKIKKLKLELDKTRQPAIVADLNKQIEELKAELTAINAADPSTATTVSPDFLVNSELSTLSNSTATPSEPYVRDELDDELDADLAASRSSYNDWEKNVLFADRAEDYAANQKQASYNKDYYNKRFEQKSDKLVDDPLLADKIVEFTDLITRLEKIASSPDYTLQNLNNKAAAISDKEIKQYIPLTPGSTNIDQFEDIILLLSSMYAKLINAEHNLSLQKSNDQSRANKLTQFDKKAEEVNNKLIEMMNRIKSMISDKKAVSYPNLANRLAILARAVDKIRNKENMAEKSRFYTYDTISDASQYWSGVSGVKQAIAPMLQQATWIQQLLRTNTLADLKRITFEKFIETIDNMYNTVLGFKNSDKVTLQQKLIQLQGKLDDEGDLKKDSATEKKVIDSPELKTLLMRDPAYKSLIAKKKGFLEELEELENTRDIYGPDDAAQVGIDYGQLLSNINKIKSVINDINADITKIELALLKARGGKKTKNVDKKSRDAIENLKYGIEQADVWDKKQYTPVKGKKGEYTASDFETFGNIKNPEFTPDYLFNKAHISKTGRDANIDFISKMGNYYDYPDSVEEYQTTDPQGRYLKSLGSDTQIGRGVDPMFMQRLMNDNASPYRHFNSLLIFEFFNKEKSKDYKEGVKDAITRWMQTNYNRKFGKTKSDLVFINKVSFYAFGLENCDLEPETGFVEQKPAEFIEDIESRFNKLSNNGKFSSGAESDTLLTPPGHTLGGVEFFKNQAARREFFQKLCDEATALDDPRSRLKLKDRSGSIIGAAFRNLYDEDVTAYFEDFIEGLGDKKLNIFLEKSIKASEFYEKYGNVIVSPYGGSDEEE